MISLIYFFKRSTFGSLNNVCKKIVINFFLLFKANFTIYIDSNLNACPKENSVNMTIFPEGLEDRVQIMLDYNCECDCQREPEAVSLDISICPFV